RECSAAGRRDRSARFAANLGIARGDDRAKAATDRGRPFESVLHRQLRAGGVDRGNAERGGVRREIYFGWHPGKREADLRNRAARPGLHHFPSRRRGASGELIFAASRSLQGTAVYKPPTEQRAVWKAPFLVESRVTSR